jgi:hypothetical protein
MLTDATEEMQFLLREVAQERCELSPEVHPEIEFQSPDVAKTEIDEVLQVSIS